MNETTKEKEKRENKKKETEEILSLFKRKLKEENKQTKVTVICFSVALFTTFDIIAPNVAIAQTACPPVIKIAQC